MREHGWNWLSESLTLPTLAYMPIRSELVGKLA